MILEDPLCNINMSAESHSSEGSKPLHVAVVYDQLNIASLLIQRGADVDALNEAGETALCKAMLLGKESMALLLLEAGARIDIPSPQSQKFPM